MQRYAITDGTSTLQGAENLAERCAQLAATGVDFILVREKHRSAGDLARLCRGIVAAVRQAGPHTRVLVAQRLDLALATGADGLHLSARPGELTTTQVRPLMPHAFVSVSCHTFEEIRHARNLGASAALFAPIFGKTIAGAEVVPGIGLNRLRQACDLAGPMPVFALGGVTQTNAPACVAAGAAGIAGIRIFL